MAWCHQATSHYLNQCGPRSMAPHGITRLQWVKWTERGILFPGDNYWDNKTSTQPSFWSHCKWHKSLGCTIRFHNKKYLARKTSCLLLQNVTIIQVILQWSYMSTMAFKINGCLFISCLKLATKQISMGYCKKEVTPVRYQWGYVFLALIHWYQGIHQWIYMSLYYPAN